MTQPGPSSPPAAVVTLAARYGAGGSYVGPRLADRLGVPFLDRAINRSVAVRTGLPEELVSSYEQKPRAGISRLLDNLSRVAPLDGPPLQVEDRDEGRLRIEVEQFMAEASLSGGVILGRGANFVLKDVVPGVVCVLLTGPRDARLRQAMTLLSVDRSTAERDLKVNDEARLGYVRRNYGADREDPSDYHLILDSTAVDLDRVVDTIVDWSAARRQAAN